MKKKNGRDRMLEDLLTTPGPSGYEEKIQDKIASYIGKYVGDVFQDRIGNLYAEIDGEGDLPTVMFNAHSDTVGFIITHIDEKGFIFTKDLGADPLDRRMLPATSVKILSSVRRQPVSGFYAVKSAHHVTWEDEQEVEDPFELSIDIGAKSRQQALSYVKEGDIGFLDGGSPRYFLNNGRIVAAGLDDRIGVYTLIRIAEMIKKSRRKKKCPVTFVFTTNEETTCADIKVACERVRPHVGIVFDVTIATDYLREHTEETIAKIHGKIHLDEGVCIAKGIGVHTKLFDLIQNTAKSSIARKRGVKYQIEPDHEYEGTENKALRTSGEGVATALLSFPCRYTHSSVEQVSLSDVESAVELGYLTYCGLSNGKLKDELMR